MVMQSSSSTVALRQGGESWGGLYLQWGLQVFGLNFSEVIFAQ